MKKKIFIALLTLICALTCALSFVACGDDKNDGNGTGTEQGGETDDKEQGGGTDDRKDAAEVTAAEWVAAIESADNYTAVSTQGGVTNTVKADKDKFEINAAGQRMVYVKDGSQYYIYTYTNSTWMRMSVSEQMYKPMADSMAESIDIFKDKKGEFTYANGVYSAETINSEVDGETVNMKNVKITFANGKLTGIEYDLSVGDDGEVHGVLSNIGTTKVEVPAQYTEINMPSM